MYNIYLDKQLIETLSKHQGETDKDGFMFHIGKDGKNITIDSPHFNRGMLVPVKETREETLSQIRGALRAATTGYIDLNDAGAYRETYGLLKDLGAKIAKNDPITLAAQVDMKRVDFVEGKGLAGHFEYAGRDYYFTYAKTEGKSGQFVTLSPNSVTGIYDRAELPYDIRKNLENRCDEYLDAVTNEKHVDEDVDLEIGFNPDEVTEEELFEEEETHETPEEEAPVDNAADKRAEKEAERLEKKQKNREAWGRVYRNRYETAYQEEITRVHEEGTRRGTDTRLNNNFVTLTAIETVLSTGTLDVLAQGGLEQIASGSDTVMHYSFNAERERNILKNTFDYEKFDNVLARGGEYANAPGGGTVQPDVLPNIQNIQPEVQTVTRPVSVSSGIQETNVPEPGAQKSDTPEQVPASNTPESGIQGTDNPEQNVPESGIPEPTVPESYIPESNISKSEVPDNAGTPDIYVHGGTANMPGQTEPTHSTLSDEDFHMWNVLVWTDEYEANPNVAHSNAIVRALVYEMCATPAEAVARIENYFNPAEEVDPKVRDYVDYQLEHWDARAAQGLMGDVTDRQVLDAFESSEDTSVLMSVFTQLDTERQIDIVTGAAAAGAIMQNVAADTAEDRFVQMMADVNLSAEQAAPAVTREQFQTMLDSFDETQRAAFVAAVPTEVANAYSGYANAPEAAGVVQDNPVMRYFTDQNVIRAAVEANGVENTLRTFSSDQIARVDFAPEQVAAVLHQVPASTVIATAGSVVSADYAKSWITNTVRTEMSAPGTPGAGTAAAGTTGTNPPRVQGTGAPNAASGTVTSILRNAVGCSLTEDGAMAGKVIAAAEANGVKTEDIARYREGSKAEIVASAMGWNAVDGNVRTPGNAAANAVGQNAGGGKGMFSFISEGAFGTSPQVRAIANSFGVLTAKNLANGIRLDIGQEIKSAIANKMSPPLDFDRATGGKLNLDGIPVELRGKRWDSNITGHFVNINGERKFVENPNYLNPKDRLNKKLLVINEKLERFESNRVNDVKNAYKQSQDYKETHKKGDPNESQLFDIVGKNRKIDVNLYKLKNGVLDLSARVGQMSKTLIGADKATPAEWEGNQLKDVYNNIREWSTIMAFGSRNALDVIKLNNVAISGAAVRVSKIFAGKYHITLDDLKEGKKLGLFSKLPRSQRKLITSRFGRNKILPMVNALRYAQVRPELLSEKSKALLKDPNALFSVKNQKAVMGFTSEMLGKKYTHLGSMRESDIKKLLKSGKLTSAEKGFFQMRLQAMQTSRLKKAGSRLRRAKALSLKGMKNLFTMGGKDADAARAYQEFASVYRYGKSAVKLGAAGLAMGAKSVRALYRVTKKVAKGMFGILKFLDRKLFGGRFANSKLAGGLNRFGKNAKKAKSAVKNAPKNVKKAAKNFVKKKNPSLYERHKNNKKKRADRKKKWNDRKGKFAAFRRRLPHNVLKRGIAKVLNAFNVVKKWVMIIIGVIILLWFLGMLIVMLIIAVVGGAGGGAEVSEADIESSSTLISDLYSSLTALSLARPSDAEEAATSYLADMDEWKTVLEGYTIDEWGHPENEDGFGNSQDEYDGLEVVYIDADGLSNLDEDGNASEDDILTYGYSNEREAIAAAIVMFDNSNLETQAFKDLVSDLYEVMNEEITVDNIAVTDIYANAYDCDDYDEYTVTYTYYCNDSSSVADARTAVADFKSYLSDLQSDGGGVYSYSWSETATDDEGSTTSGSDGGELSVSTTTTNDDDQLIVRHNINDISVTTTYTGDGCMSREVIVDYEEETHHYVDDYGVTVYYTTTTPVYETEYYCNGHEVTLTATVDYGRRDATVYLVTWTLDDLLEYFTVEEYLPDWESASYASYIQGFVDGGQFSTDGGEDDEITGFYAEWIQILLETDWQETYGISLDYDSWAVSVTTSELSDDEISELVNNLVLTGDLTEIREELVSDALSMVGRIPYYWGGKADSAVYEENNFYSTVTADYKGRTQKGLDCSGFVNFIFWRVTGNSAYLSDGSTRSAPGTLFTDYTLLEPGDIGLYKVSGSSDNHIGIFVGWDDDGNALWVHCSGSSGVTLSSYPAGTKFVYYYKVSSETITG